MWVGYYPPDHSIVTGGPNNLDSFEALLYVPSILHFNFCTHTNLLIFGDWVGNLRIFLAKLNHPQFLRMRSTNLDWRSSKRLSCLNMRMMERCLLIVLIGCVVFFPLFQFGNVWKLITTIYFFGSVLSVWMIISPRRIFALCHVVMLSIKLALMSGYRLEGIIVLLVEQRYVPKKHFTTHICLIFIAFSSRAWRLA